MGKGKVNLESHAGYRTEKAISDKLHADLATAENEERAIETRISRAQIQTSIQVEAAALLGGKTIEAGFNPAERDVLERVRHRLVVLRQAIKQHAPVLDRAFGQASMAVCQELKPAYQAIIHEIGLALIALARAAEAERSFRDQLERVGVRFYLVLMSFGALGDPLEYGSRITTWLREAVVEGFLRKDEVPAEWLDKWGVYIDKQLRDRAAAEQESAKAAPTMRRESTSQVHA